jgi:predicted MPP superfamily phosphohydrolase
MSFLLPSICASALVLAGSIPGQIRLFSHGLFAPGQGFLPEYTSGIHRNLVITRGLSNPAMVPRLFNPVEIIYITKKK